MERNAEEDIFLAVAIPLYNNNNLKSSPVLRVAKTLSDAQKLTGHNRTRKDHVSPRGSNLPRHDAVFFARHWSRVSFDAFKRGETEGSRHSAYPFPLNRESLFPPVIGSVSGIRRVPRGVDTAYHLPWLDLSTFTCNLEKGLPVPTLARPPTLRQRLTDSTPIYGTNGINARTHTQHTHTHTHTHTTHTHTPAYS